MLRITVGKKDENYTSIMEAIEAIPYLTPAEIVISEGFYHEKIFSDKDDLTIIGKGNVIISYSDCGYEILDRFRKRGTFRSYTAFFGGRRLRLENISIRNGAGAGDAIGQGIALYLDVSDAELDNVRILGHQDTLFLAPLPDEEREENGFYGPRYLLPRNRTKSIFHNCYIEGTVDFIFGGGDALFEDCEIRSLDKGYVTAPSGKKEWAGLVFYNSSFEASGIADGSVFLMRPWRKEGKSLFINSKFGRHIAPSGLSAWNGRDDEIDEATFGVYECAHEGVFAPDAERVMSEEEVRKALEFFTR